MFQLPKEVNESIKDYKRNLDEFLKGEISSSRFKGIRVPWGFYSHRGGEIFMARIRIPSGLISSSQLRVLALAAKNYGNGILHITTRQDIQIHAVKIEDTIKIIEQLKEFNLSSRGGGGNTVRNVIACPLSGVCKDEIFDVREQAIALSEHFLRQETSFNLPRKFKVSFSGCAIDCAGCLLNDVGFLALERDGRRGFKVFVGGGMGAQTRTGKLLEEFIKPEEAGYCVTAVKNVFYRKGDRRNKQHNRLRFLIEDIGIDNFKQFYKQELEELKNNEHIVLRRIKFSHSNAEAGGPPEVNDEEYKQFLKYSVREQNVSGFRSVELRIPRGDIEEKRLRSLADIDKDFGNIEFRLSQNQNLFLTWIRAKDLYKLFLRLKDILADFIYPDTLVDVVACKGALTCNLGLCNSPGLAKEIESKVKENFLATKIFRKLQIKLNGCPNACGHQPIGDLSFYGMVKRVEGRPVPFYKFLLGGRKQGQATKLAQEIGIVPAKNLIKFLDDFLKRIEEKIGVDEDIHKFLNSDAKSIAKETLEKYVYVPSYLQDKSFYIDWGKQEEFSLKGLGPGECGAGVIDILEADLTAAKLVQDEAEKEGYSLDKIKKTLFLAARTLLLVRGSDSDNEAEVFSAFKEQFIDSGIASSTYSDIEQVYASLCGQLDVIKRKEKFTYTQEFLRHINQIYKSMDPSFNFPKQRNVSPSQERPKNQLDLKGTPCPINYVKAKLFLENLASGDISEIILDAGEPMDNVPKSLEADGHSVFKIKKEGNLYRIFVKKK